MVQEEQYLYCTFVDFLLYLQNTHQSRSFASITSRITITVGIHGTGGPMSQGRGSETKEWGLYALTHQITNIFLSLVVRVLKY